MHATVWSRKNIINFPQWPAPPKIWFQNLSVWNSLDQFGTVCGMVGDKLTIAEDQTHLGRRHVRPGAVGTQGSFVSLKRHQWSCATYPNGQFCAKRLGRNSLEQFGTVWHCCQRTAHNLKLREIGSFVSPGIFTSPTKTLRPHNSFEDV